jgi:hypothetical protein
MKKKIVEKKTADSRLAAMIYEEYNAEEIVQFDEDEKFEEIMDILECNRTEKDYDWMSDVFVPEFASLHLTEASQWANQYFQSRDFVEVYLDGSSQESYMKAQAAKLFINSMLNVKAIYHYQKYMRARAINSMRGYVIAVCGWKQNLKNNYRIERTDDPIGMDDQGQPIKNTKFTTVNDTEPLEDHFYYEIPDPRNVRFDRTYCYSIAEKQWVTIRSEMTYDQLKDKEEENGYINLDQVKKMVQDQISDSTRILKDDKDRLTNYSRRLTKTVDVLERWGKVYAIITETDDDGYPTKMRSGYDDNGELLESAELVESIVTVAYTGGHRVLIRFQPTPFRTSKNVPYRPIVRGLCYVHPTKDVGLSDGLYAKELQILTNDMVNMGIDRTKLATFPTLKMKRHAFDDNDSVYFEPEHPILVDDMNDIEEFKIQDNIQGALAIVDFGIKKMQQVQSIYPTTMGELPGKASTTATAVSGAESRTNLRANYKALTFEYTFLQEFYWIMLQMAYQFMHPKTAQKIMGKLAPYFDPEEEYNFQPVTSNIEAEYSKDKKLQRYNDMLGKIGSIPNPAVVPILAFIVGRQLEILGDEYQTVAPMVQKMSQTPNQPEQASGAVDQSKGQNAPTSNQNGHEMSLQEQAVRG